jgi:Protein of unknown function (DUF3108)
MPSLNESMSPRNLFVLGVAAALSFVALPAQAQGQFDANYTLSMAGISIGKLNWRTQIGASDYTISASGRTSGILSVLLSGEGHVSLKGTMRDGRSQSAIWSSIVARDDEKSIVNMTFEAGKVRELKVIEPPLEADRVPIVEAHKNSVIDPLSAFLIPASAGDPLQPSACQRDLNIFDGRRRYDIALSFRRLDKATPEKGYNGPALVCAARFSPISGHRASSPLVKFLLDGRDIEVWLVPIAGTPLLAPVRLSVASALGSMVLRADQFETTPALASGK